jgi:hypothetical protein
MELGPRYLYQRRLEAALEIAELHSRIGEHEAGIDLLRAMLRRGRALPPGDRARVLLRMAMLHTRRGEFARAGTLFEEGFAAARAKLSTSERLYFLNEHAAMLSMAGEHRRAVELCRSGLRFAGRRRSRAVREVALNLHATLATVALRSFDNEVLRFHFRVDPDTSATQAAITFQDGGVNDFGRAEVNEVTARGESNPPETIPAGVLLNSVVEVLPDVFIFVRGETNGDARVDISDAQRILNFLFLGGAEPTCFDAADVNDDGRLDLSDPTRLLGYLFLGDDPLPAPFPEAGVDPSADGLGCYYRD